MLTFFLNKKEFKKRPILSSMTHFPTTNLQHQKKKKGYEELGFSMTFDVNSWC
jgi:hypothetical protein